MHYGLHPNAEIEFLTVTSDKLFHTLLELQSPDAVMGEGASQTLEEKVATPTSSHPESLLLIITDSSFPQVKTILDEVLEKLPEEYNMSDITSKTAERSPYILVCFQECERMNILISEMRRSLKELDLGLKVRLAASRAYCTYGVAFGISKPRVCGDVTCLCHRVNWPFPLRWRSCSQPCSLTPSLIPGPSWPTPPHTACLHGACLLQPVGVVVGRPLFKMLLYITHT